MLRSRTCEYKVPRCTRCDRPRRGHEGPCGKKCNMPSLSVVESSIGNDWESVSNVDGKPPQATVNSTPAFVLKELARQLGELTNNVSTLMSKQRERETGGSSSADVVPSLTSSGHRETVLKVGAPRPAVAGTCGSTIPGLRVVVEVRPPPKLMCR